MALPKDNMIRIIDTLFRCKICIVDTYLFKISQQTSFRADDPSLILISAQTYKILALFEMAPKASLEWNGLSFLVKNIQFFFFLTAFKHSGGRTIRYR